jgi:hypothetical protein
MRKNPMQRPQKSVRGRAVLAGAQAALIGLFAGEAFAGEAPTALRGKSIVARWQDERTTKDVDTGDIRYSDLDSMITAYVSDKGRVFSSYSRVASRSRARGRRVASLETKEVSDLDNAKLIWQFSDDTLLLNIPLKSGLRRVTVTFGVNFDSCTISVVNAHLAGTEHPKVLSLKSGVERELLDVKVTNADCSIRDGNVFQ